MQHDFNLAILSDFSSPDFWVGPGDYNWGTVDRVVDFALEQGWRVLGSHLVWGAPEFLPPWLMREPFFSRDPLVQRQMEKEYYTNILVNHIKEVMGHYKGQVQGKGRVQEWSVANEAIERIACQQKRLLRLLVQENRP